MNVFDNIQVETHAVCESSMLKATITGPIYSLKCHKDMDNGTICTFGDYKGSQVFASKDYEANKLPILILTPPVGYNSDKKSYQDEKYFYNAQDEIARGYTLYVGDIWTVSEDIFQGTPEVGKYIDATYTVQSSEQTGFSARIIEKGTYANSVYYRLHLESTGV